MGQPLGLENAKRVAGRVWYSRWLSGHSDRNARSLLTLASGLALASGGLLCLLEETIWFVLPMLWVVMAYGMAIPNILARALRHYKDCVGTAGAILGLMYSLMRGTGLILAGLAQRLGLVLITCGTLALLLAWRVTHGECDADT